jgi:hypothetical protein
MKALGKTPWTIEEGEGGPVSDFNANTRSQLERCAEKGERHGSSDQLFTNDSRDACAVADFTARFRRDPVGHRVGWNVMRHQRVRTDNAV